MNIQTIWFTGRPCSGKTTIADKLKGELVSRAYNPLRLDGDVVRKGLCKDLGFSNEDRFENLRRIAEVSKIYNENGASVIASFVSPYEETRKMINEIVGDRFKLIYVECSLEECEKRDVKGMYAQARRGEIKGFTGIDAPFEAPLNPYMVLNTENTSLEECVDQVLKNILK